jgi:hypothetical protein
MRENVSVSSTGNSCEVLLDKELNEVLTCFFVATSNNQYISAVSFLPENNFSTIYNFTYNINNFIPQNVRKIISSKYDKTKALVCYHKNTYEAGCFVYNTTDYSMSSIIFNFSDCSSRIYASDIFYFDYKKEFIFSCGDGKDTLHLAKISQDLNFFEEYNMETYKYNNCFDLNGYSIIYLKNLNIYSVILIMFCNNKYSIVNHLLTNNETNCNNTVKYLNTSKNSEINEYDNDKFKTSNTIETNIQMFESSGIIESTQIIGLESSTSQVIVQSQTTDINNISDTKINSNEITELNRISNTIQKSSIFDEKTENKETSKITNLIYNTNIIDSTINKSDELIQTEHYLKCSEKCSECDEESVRSDLCIKCNNQNNYYELKSYNKGTNDNSTYVACYSQKTKPPNYFLKDNFFEECFYTCGSCNEKGNQDDNKCLTCSSNYIIDPNNINNCVIQCKYYYYYTDYGEYKCSYDNQCPEEASLLVPELLKCTKNCKEEIYKFQYNGQCIDECPDDTSANEETYICEIKNINV